jgi:hypothetical protein
VFRNAGHDALTVLDQSAGGQPDPAIAAVCEAEHRALVALDLEFSDIRTFPPANYPGITWVRVNREAF